MGKVGNVLRSLRIREDLTQEELAKKLNMKRSTIGMYETGERTPDSENIISKNLKGFQKVDILGFLILNNLKPFQTVGN